MDATREAIKDNRRPSANPDRVWELVGGMLFCDECGNRMSVHTSVNHRNGEEIRCHYYRCPKRQRPGLEACAHNTHYRAAEREARVWEFVSGVLRDPERLRAGLEEMIEQEKAGSRGDPGREIAIWLEKAAGADRKRSGFQDQAAEGLITLDELRTRLAGLEETRRAAETEIERLRGRLERVADLERDRDALLEDYANLIPEALQELGPEERRQVYAMLRLRKAVEIGGDMEVTGVIGAGATLCESGLASTCVFRNTKTPSLTFRPVVGDGDPQIRLEVSIVR